MEKEKELKLFDAKGYEKQIKISIKEILNAEFKEDQEIEIYYLIYCVQQYCRKGGKKDLW